MFSRWYHPLTHFRNSPPPIPFVPYSFPLPGDDPEALTLLYNALHFQTEEIPETPSPTCLENLAIISDKYRCAFAIGVHAASWMRKCPSDPRDLYRLLVVSYSLDLPESFSAVSWEILQRRVGVFCDLRGVAGHKLVERDLLRMSTHNHRSIRIMALTKPQRNLKRSRQRLLWMC